MNSMKNHSKMMQSFDVIPINQLLLQLLQYMNKVLLLLSKLLGFKLYIPLYVFKYSLNFNYNNTIRNTI